MVTLGYLNSAPYSLADGTVMRDAVSGTEYTVTGGSLVDVVVPSNWGAVLLDTAVIDVPGRAPAAYAEISGIDVLLSWQPVVRDTRRSRELAVSRPAPGHRARLYPWPGQPAGDGRAAFVRHR
jgi:hypothetical protein